MYGLSRGMVQQGFGTNNSISGCLKWSILDYQWCLWKKKAIVSGHGDALTWYNFTTRKVKELQIPALGNIVGYTESLVSIAKSVRQRQPTADHSLHQEFSSTEIITSLAAKHEEDNQEGSVVETVFQQLLLQGKQTPENHEDDDADISSMDSAFVAPGGPGFLAITLTLQY